MGYLDGFVNSSFKKTGKDKSIFYPYGILGSGYSVSKDKETEIKRFLKILYAAYWIAFLIIVLLFKSRVLWLVLLGLPWYYIKIKSLLKGTERTQERTSLGEQTERMAVANGLFVNIIFLGMSILMTGASILLLFLPNSRAKHVGILGVVFFGVCLLFTTALVKYSMRARRLS